MPDQNSHSHTEPDRGQVMAYWVSCNEEWRSFFRWKQKRRLLYCMLIVLFIIASITGLLYGVLQLNSLTAFITGLSAGAGFGIMRCPIVVAFIRVVLLRTNDVVITSSGVSINGRFSFFNNDVARLQQVQIIDETNPKVLQINFNRLTPRGIIPDQIFIPIPKGRLGEAVKLMSMLGE